ncbi:MAG: NAD(P)/FAD-dependent oxidoreductase [Alphaproteobacteria bacterium]
MVEKAAFDAIIIGAGHNGLACAAYLASAGLSVKVFERRHVIGGAAVTEEFHPGFKNSVCSYTVSLLNPKVIRELELERHGLEIVARPYANFLPLPDGNYLRYRNDLDEMRAAISPYSERDADRLGDYFEVIEETADILRALALETPPNPGGGVKDILKTLRMGRRLRKAGPRALENFAKLMTMSVGDYLDGWFESDPLKGMLGFDGIVGNLVSPYHPGSAYVLIHHAIGEINGQKGAWGHAIGGMGAISEAIARSGRAKGVEIETEAPVAELLVEGGKTRGVKLADGREVTARITAANVNPKLLFLKLVPADALEPEVKRRMENWRCRSGSFRMNVALGELPDFTCLPGTNLQEHHMSGIYLCPSLGYMERAYDDAKGGDYSKEPAVDMLISSTVDASLAPEGRHVASLFCQHFHPELSDGRSWIDVKEAAVDTIIETVNRYAPNFRSSIIAVQSLSPLDLEREFGLTGGDIFHGCLDLDQIFSLRPMMGHADYRMPLKNLYLCGSGAHPGGGVTGLPGRNAAREIIKDFRRRRV